MIIAAIFIVTLGYGIHANQPKMPEDLPLVDLPAEQMEEILNENSNG
jgi:hypothetical protein